MCGIHMCDVKMAAANASFSGLRQVIQDLGLSHLEENFVREKVTTTEQVHGMNDSQLSALGVTTIGDRHRLRQRCQARGSILSRFMPRRQTGSFFSRLSNPPAKKAKMHPWTHRFVCLADPDAEKAPPPIERQELKDAGLGELSITFDLNSTPKKFEEVLVEKFPKLKNSGGFELLICHTNVRSQNLSRVKGAYSPRNLKECVGQGRIYIRPIQHCLDMTVDGSITSEGSGLMQKCKKCDMEVELHKLRQHCEECKQTEDTSDAAHDIQESENEAWQVPSTSRGSNTITPSGNEVAYNDYANLWPSDDSCDEDFLMAVENSLNDTRPKGSPVENNGSSLKDVLAPYSVSDDHDGVQLIVVRRRRLLKSIMFAVQQPQFSVHKLANVEFVGEEGVDVGGPRREMFRLLMKAVVDEMGILEGHDGGLYFTHNVDLLEKGSYELAGKLVMWSLKQGGPGLPVLGLQLYWTMFTGEKPTFTPDIVTDVDVREKLDKLAACSKDNFREVADELADWASERGITRLYRGIFDEKDKIVSSLVKQHVVYRTQSEITQFKKGLGDLLSAVEQYPTLFQQVFTCQHNQPLTRQIVKSITTVKWSPEGSNRRALEEDTMFSWQIFMNNCEDGKAKTSVEDVLVFITGADKVPPMGFPNGLGIDFFTPLTPDMKSYPTATTCTQELRLPRGIGEPAQFQALMEEAILNTQGFGKL